MNGNQELTYEQTKEELAYSLGFQACLWGRPLCEYMETIYPAMKNGGSHINSFHYFDKPKPSSIRFVRTPNNVTIDAYAAGDLREEPIVLVVPKQEDDRWSIVQIGDHFDNVAYNVGASKGQEPGVFVITGPDNKGLEFPAYMKQITVSTTFAVVALRVVLNGMADLEAARAVQRTVKLIPYSKYVAHGIHTEFEEPVNDPDYYEQFHFVPSVEAGLERYEYIGKGMKLFLSKNSDYNDPIVQQFHQIGLSVKEGFNPEGMDEPTKRGLIRANEAAEQLIRYAYTNMVEKADGWNYIYTDGKPNHSFALRASLATYVPGGNLAEEIIYGNTWVDSNDEQLHGKNRYVLRFEKDRLPQARIFWNLAMYAEDMLFVKNDFVDASGDPYGRCTIGSTTDGIKYDDDGSITILIQHERPEETANWLPAPDAIFNLTLRMYGPSADVLAGNYRLPAVEKVG